MAHSPSIDPDLFLQFVEASILVRSAEQFCILIGEHVRPLLPHHMMVGAIVRLNFDTADIFKMQTIGYPEEFARTLRTTVNLRDRTVAARWLASRTPVYADLVSAYEQLSELQQREARHFSLDVIAVHGLLDLSSNMGSYFSFARVDRKVPPADICHVLRLITPYLHVALVQVRDLPVLTPDPLATLTSTERDLLNWLSAGRSNRQIAQLRGRSPSTVRNQLEVLYRKLGVSNRAEAARLAASLGVAARSSVRNEAQR